MSTQQIVGTFAAHITASLITHTNNLSIYNSKNDELSLIM